MNKMIEITDDIVNAVLKDTGLVETSTKTMTMKEVVRKYEGQYSSETLYLAASCVGVLLARITENE